MLTLSRKCIGEELKCKKWKWNENGEWKNGGKTDGKRLRSKIKYIIAWKKKFQRDRFLFEKEIKKRNFAFGCMKKAYVFKFSRQNAIFMPRSFARIYIGIPFNPSVRWCYNYAEKPSADQYWVFEWSVYAIFMARG